MSLLNEIEPLKQSALGELKAAPDLAALEQSKGVVVRRRDYSITVISQSISPS